MSLKLLLPLLLSYQLVHAQQNYPRLSLTADNLVAYKKYKQAVVLYELLEATSYPFDKTKAAKAYVCTQQPQKALELLQYASTTQLWDTKHFFDTTALAQMEEWQQLKESLYYRWQAEQYHQLVYHIAPSPFEKALFININNVYHIHKEIPINPPMIPFRVTDKRNPHQATWGFVHPKNKKKWLMKPVFSTFSSLYPLGAIVGSSLEDGNQKYIYGLIGADGKFKIPMEYTYIIKEGKWYHALKIKRKKTKPNSHFSPYLPKQWLDGGVYFQHDYYNEAGQLVFTEKSVDFQSYNKNRALAWFRKGTHISIRDQQGNRIQQLETTDTALVFAGISGQFINYLEQEGDSVFIRAYNQSHQLQYQLFLSMVDSSGLSFPYQQPQACYELSEHLYLLERNGKNDILLIDTKQGRKYAYDHYSNVPGYLPNYSQQPAFWVYLPNSINMVSHKEYISNLLNRKGKFLLSSKTEKPNFVSDLMFVNSREGYLQLMDTSGKKRTLQEIHLSGHYYYELPYGFHEGWGVAHKSCQDANSSSSYNCVYYFDTTGKTTLTLDDSIIDAAPFSDGMALAQSKNGKYGYINKKGEWAILPKYDWEFHFPTSQYFHFHNGYAYWPNLGYIDKRGQQFFSEK